MKTLLLLFASLSFSFATTHEVHRVFQALSLHGTDVDSDFEGEAIQARIISFPVVTFGAMPEALIDSIGAPHKIPGPDSYQIPEANLLVLCGVDLTSELTEDSLEVTFNLSKLRIPDEVELSIRMILQLNIQAVKKTLNTYYKEGHAQKEIEIIITGTSAKNFTLNNLSTEFTAGK